MITAMLLTNTKRPFALAFGKSDGPGYMHSWYNSMQDVYEALPKLLPGKRKGYELILADKPYRNYADIEFVGQRDEKPAARENPRSQGAHLRVLYKKIQIRSRARCEL